MRCKAITSEQMRRIAVNAENHFGMKHTYMMENVGHGVADFIVTRFKDKLKNNKKIIAVCGTGFNGGDALVAARHLACNPYCPVKLSVILLGDPRKLRSDTRFFWDIINKMDSIEIISGDKVIFDEDVKTKISKAGIIIDGIIAAPLKEGQMYEQNAYGIELINNSKKSYVVSIDVPSGIDQNTGKVYDDNKCVKADVTIVYHRMKTGLLNNKKYTGIIHIENIGIPKEAERGIIA